MTTENEIPESVRNTLKILIVEDNILNQKLLGFMLKNWGFQYETCNNGKEAVDILKNKKYDLVLMDIEMPEMNGYMATRYMRQDLRLDVPVIATTAHASEGERERCLEHGMSDYIAKPIRGEKLYKMMVQYLMLSRNKAEKSGNGKHEGLEGR